MEGLLKSAAAAAMVYGSHYAGIKLYDRFCVPDGLWGFLGGMLTTASPVCSATLKIVETTETSYSSAVLFGISRFFIDMVGSVATKVL
jgi:hypothetical protein